MRDCISQALAIDTKLRAGSPRLAMSHIVHMGPHSMLSPSAIVIIDRPAHGVASR
jgi:hypothetical protein